MKIELEDIAYMTPERTGAIRSLFSLHEFRTLFSQFKEAKDDASLSTSELIARQTECMKSMVGILREKESIIDAANCLSSRERSDLLHKLDDFERYETAENFPTVPESNWNWPPTPDFCEYVECMIYKHTADLENWHV